MDVNIRIAGEAGQGVQTTGNLPVGAFARMGLHLFATQSYLSRIRGGLNWFDIRAADIPEAKGRSGFGTPYPGASDMSKVNWWRSEP